MRRVHAMFITFRAGALDPSFRPLTALGTPALPRVYRAATGRQPAGRMIAPMSLQATKAIQVGIRCPHCGRAASAEDRIFVQRPGGTGRARQDRLLRRSLAHPAPVRRIALVGAQSRLGRSSPPRRAEGGASGAQSKSRAPVAPATFAQGLAGAGGATFPAGAQLASGSPLPWRARAGRPWPFPRPRRTQGRETSTR